MKTVYLVFQSLKDGEFCLNIIAPFTTFEKAMDCVNELLNCKIETFCYHIYEYELDNGNLVSVHRYD